MATTSGLLQHPAMLPPRPDAVTDALVSVPLSYGVLCAPSPGEVRRPAPVAG